MLAAPGASLVVQGRGNGHGAGGRPDIVSGRDTDLCRRVILGAGQAHHASHALDDCVEGAHVPVRAVVAEPGKRAVN